METDKKPFLRTPRNCFHWKSHVWSARLFVENRTVTSLSCLHAVVSSFCEKSFCFSDEPSGLLWRLWFNGSDGEHDSLFWSLWRTTKERFLTVAKELGFSENNGKQDLYTHFQKVRHVTKSEEGSVRLFSGSSANFTANRYEHCLRVKKKRLVFLWKHSRRF